MLRSLLMLCAGAIAASAHDVITTKLTWSVEISRIVYNRCASCHRDGGTAPMPLITWEQARPWAKAIRDEVLNRRMPPWGAIRGYGELKDDRSLTQDEITRIAEWVEGGAPEGDPKYLPATIPSAAPPAAASAQGRILKATRLKVPATLTGLKPLSDVANAKIYAVLPDGSVEPLLWLKDYRQRWSHTFTFAREVRLPAGTRIVAEPRVPFHLLIK